MPADTDREYSHGSGIVSLWAGVLAGPLAWFAVLEAKFILVRWACPIRLLTLAHLP